MTKAPPEQFLRTLDILKVRPEKAAHISDLPTTDFLRVSHRQDGRLLADAVFEEYGELE